MRRSAVRSRLAPPAYAASRLRLASPTKNAQSPTRLRPAPPAVRAVLVRAAGGHGELPDAHRGGGLAALRADRRPVRPRPHRADPVRPRDAAVSRGGTGH